MSNKQQQQWFLKNKAISNHSLISIALPTLHQCVYSFFATWDVSGLLFLLSLGLFECDFSDSEVFLLSIVFADEWPLALSAFFPELAPLAVLTVFFCTCSFPGAFLAWSDFLCSLLVVSFLAVSSDFVELWVFDACSGFFSFVSLSLASLLLTAASEWCGASAFVLRFASACFAA